MALACFSIAACGGSGSTGLITAESALLEQVRDRASCVAVDDTSYCATDSANAIAPGGQTADGGQIVPGPACSPGDPPSCDDRATASFDLTGFSSGAACAVAARPRGSADAWTSGTLTPIGDSAKSIAFPLPAGMSADATEVVLLCFIEAPSSLPEQARLLRDFQADVVFVP